MHQSSGGRGNKNNNNWQRFQQQQHQYHHNSTLESHPNKSQSFYPYQQSRVTVNAPPRQKEVVVFIEKLRANQSSLAAPPNALTINVVVQAICNHFHVNTFEDLMGISPLQLPILKQLHTVNQRVWTFVTCFIQSRRIHTLLECQEFFYNKKDFNRFTN
ncbi:unnamed protein product [Peronospora effusa]|nr:unnamed protein product [Peronospora effusa]